MPGRLAALAEKAKAVGEKRTLDQAGALEKPCCLGDIGGNATALNATNPDVLASVLGAGDGAALKSDADEQLIISMTLPQTVKLTAIKLAGPADGTAPATVKLFVNKSSMSFDDCTDYPATQTLNLSSAEATLPLQQTKFTSVSSLTVFIESNQGDEEATQLSHLALVGVPVHTTNVRPLAHAESRAEAPATPRALPPTACALLVVSRACR